MSRISFCLILLALCCVPGVAEETELMDRDELLKGIQAYEKNLQAFTVEMQIDKEVLPPEGQGDLQKSRINLKATSDFDGRFIFIEQGDPSIAEGRPLRAGTFDGKTLSQIIGQNDMIERGSIGNNPLDAIWEIDPRNYVTHIAGIPLSKQIIESNAQVVRTWTYNGHPCQVFETPVTTKDGVEYKEAYFIMPTQGFATLMRTYSKRFPPDPGWMEYSRLLTNNHRVYGNSVWLPQNSFYVLCNVKQGDPPGVFDKYPITEKRVVQFLTWIPNPKVQQSDFQFDFPAGIEIEDQRQEKQD